MLNGMAMASCIIANDHCIRFVSVYIKLSFLIKIKHALKVFGIILFEPVYGIFNNVVCGTSKASDQPAHTRSLIRAFACCLNIL